MEHVQNENTNNTKKESAAAYMNVTVSVQAADGTWYKYNTGIPMYKSKAVDRGLIGNPEVIADPERIAVNVGINVVQEIPENVSF